MKKKNAGNTPAVSTAALIDRLKREFPFPRYFYLGTEAQAHMLDEVRDLLPQGSKVLDIGCGPLDKLAPIAWAGYACSAIDDFSDPWHRMGDNLKRIQAFAKANDIALKVGDGKALPYPEKSFDLVMLNDVLEHMATSPRLLVNAAVSLLKPNGVLMITVPNAVNIRKRIDVLRGRTNLPPFNQYYWSDGLWRGHIREYVKEDLAELAHYAGLQVEKLESCHHMLGVLPAWAQPLYKAATQVFPGWRDSWILVARRPARWVPQTGMALARHYGVETVPDFVK